MGNSNSSVSKASQDELIVISHYTAVYPRIPDHWVDIAVRGFMREWEARKAQGENLKDFYTSEECSDIFAPVEGKIAPIVAFFRAIYKGGQIHRAIQEENANLAARRRAAGAGGGGNRFRFQLNFGGNDVEVDNIVNDAVNNANNAVNQAIDAANAANNNAANGNANPRRAAGRRLMARALRWFGAHVEVGDGEFRFEWGNVGPQNEDEALAARLQRMDDRQLAQWLEGEEGRRRLNDDNANHDGAANQAGNNDGNAVNNNDNAAANVANNSGDVAENNGAANNAGQNDNVAGNNNANNPTVNAANNAAPNRFVGGNFPNKSPTDSKPVENPREVIWGICPTSGSHKSVRVPVEVQNRIKHKLEHMMVSLHMTNNEQVAKLDSLFPLAPKENLRNAVTGSERNLILGIAILLGERPTEINMVEPRSEKRQAVEDEQKLNTMVAETERITLKPEHLFMEDAEMKCIRDWCANEFPRHYEQQIKNVLDEKNYNIVEAYDILAESHRKESPSKDNVVASIGTWFISLFKTEDEKEAERKKKESEVLAPGEHLRGEDKISHLNKMPAQLAAARRKEQEAKDAEVATMLNISYNYDYMEHGNFQTFANRGSAAMAKIANAQGGRNGNPTETMMEDHSPVVGTTSGITSRGSTNGMTARRGGSTSLGSAMAAASGFEMSDMASGVRKRGPKVGCFGPKFGSRRSLDSPTDFDDEGSVRPGNAPSSGGTGRGVEVDKPMSIGRGTVIASIGVSVKNYLTCECCFDDEVTSEGAVQCEAGHVFCKNCMIHNIDNLVSGQYGRDVIEKNSKGRLLCFCNSEACDSHFSRQTLCMLACSDFVEEQREKNAFAEKLRHGASADRETGSSSSDSPNLTSNGSNLLCDSNLLRDSPFGGDKTEAKVEYPPSNSPGRFLHLPTSYCLAADDSNKHLKSLEDWWQRKSLTAKRKQKLDEEKKKADGMNPAELEARGEHGVPVPAPQNAQVHRIDQNNQPIPRQMLPNDHYLREFDRLCIKLFKRKTWVELSRPGNARKALIELLKNAKKLLAFSRGVLHRTAKDRKLTLSGNGIYGSGNDGDDGFSIWSSDSRSGSKGFLTDIDFCPYCGMEAIAAPSTGEIVKNSKRLQERLCKGWIMFFLVFAWFWYDIIYELTGIWVFSTDFTLMGIDLLNPFFYLGFVHNTGALRFTRKMVRTYYFTILTELLVVWVIPPYITHQVLYTTTRWVAEIRRKLGEEHGAWMVVALNLVEKVLRRVFLVSRLFVQPFETRVEKIRNYRCCNPNCSILFCNLCGAEAHYFPDYGGRLNFRSGKGFQDKSQPVCPVVVQMKYEKEAFVSFVADSMSQRKVRMCPDCGIQFTKVDGCNRMQCPECRCTMCYLCKNKIHGYDHFCSHPRDPGETLPPTVFCRKCDRCPLYKDYDDRLVKKAGETAVKLYQDKFGKAEIQKLFHPRRTITIHDQTFDL